MKFGRQVWTFFGEFACPIFMVDSILNMEAVCSKKIIGTYLSYSSHYWYVSVVQFTFCETAILNFTAVRTSDLVKEEIILCHNIQYKPG